MYTEALEVYLYPMHSNLEKKIVEHTGADSITNIEVVQSLWSDFGSLERVSLDGGKYSSVIVKRIQPPSKVNHPRGWNTDVSTQRKLKSYAIEQNWYQNYVHELPSVIRTPQYFFQMQLDSEVVLVMEDLNASGYSYRYDASSEECFESCLDWLANFHAFYMHQEPIGLWEVGTYWHFDTRFDEWNSMPDGKLKNAAKEIDTRLKQCKYQTLVHGDAKPANFCFNESKEAAAVDFQYVGKGCGVKDVIYLMSSALRDTQLFASDTFILDVYFKLLKQALQTYKRSDVDFELLKSEWMSMYAFAWADFVRFLEGWSPAHTRHNEYAKKIVASALGL